MKTTTALLFTAILLFALESSLGAQPRESLPDDFNEGGGATISGSVGAGVGYAPEFAGSGESSAKFLPVVFLNYGPVFLNSDKGLGVRFDLLQGSLEISPAVNYRWARNENLSPLLSGMGDVRGVVTLGGTIAYHYSDFVFSAQPFKGVNNSKGFNMNLKAAYLNRSSESFNYGISVSTSLADKAYNQTYFGVTPEQSRRSGYREYKADSGFKDVGLKGTFDFFLSPEFSVDVFAGYTHLMGEAGKSPLVERGSENQFSTGLIFLYHFGR
ncbi:MAG: MipA/OmpV family protein [Deltaproteobacteria bacterium]|jgi:outer membrane scaffolding protein for murein synthesis (MipA/OmpV family)|nr:MipA/OmpV family protein [Deltaproteobacteria bacterium]